MNRLHNHHGITLVVLPVAVSIGILIFGVIETVGLSCRTQNSETFHAAESVTNNPGSQGHCLIYGKYCLSAILHGK
jgi:hypothetical protein